MGGPTEARAKVASPATGPWSDLCPYLRDASGTWRAARPSAEHRCTAVTPPEPLGAEKQRRLCLGAGHLECPTYLAARELRARAPGFVDGSGSRQRRPIALTLPTILQWPGPGAVAVALLRDSAPQVGLLVLIVLGAVALVMARLVGP